MTTKASDSVLDLSALNQGIDTGNNPLRGLPTPTTPDEGVSKDYLETQIAIAQAALQALATPPGLGPLPWSSTTPPTGWLLCDGTVYNFSTYPALAGVLGGMYGGDGITTFGVPDIRGRFPLGLNTIGFGANRVNRTGALFLGSGSGVGGEEYHQITAGEMPSHSHTGTTDNSVNHVHTGTTTINGDHFHTTTAGNSDNIGQSSQNHPLYAPGTPTSTAGAHSHSLTINSSGSHTHTFTTNNAGTNVVHNNVPPFLTVSYIIKHD